ncbi:uncharacterized protein LOC122036520 [Zingiber officinale]|uniref:uncharacterized protein LOC122036520 n=1 Tax=Zingiber officinale TaxID=94328 RepID=UPI001C4CEFF9|nr:uncharacterized protein LOC122036520 [Zingiber officinale]
MTAKSPNLSHPSLFSSSAIYRVDLFSLCPPLFSLLQRRQISRALRSILSFSNDRFLALLSLFSPSVVIDFSTSTESFFLIFLFLARGFVSRFQIYTALLISSRQIQMMGGSENLPDVQGKNSSKLVIIFCDYEHCDDDKCYCCENLPSTPCFHTWEECRAKCPKCDPTC